jgi:hypothetical protein
MARTVYVHLNKMQQYALTFYFFLRHDELVRIDRFHNYLFTLSSIYIYPSFE